MLSIDKFEQELQEAYGQIFTNIADIRARKRKVSVTKLDDREQRKAPCSFERRKKDSCNSKLLQDQLKEIVKNQEDNAEIRGKLDTQRFSFDPYAKNTTVKEQLKERRLPVKESKEYSLLGDKDVGHDFDNKMQTILDTISQNNVQDGKLPGFVLQNARREHANSAVEIEAASEIETIQYKTVHTKNDTLYIFTANV